MERNIQREGASALAQNAQEEPQLELWGGVECTCNRIHEAYVDQLELSGHRHQLEDLDRIAELGIRTLRYPVLWECASPQDEAHIDWRWADARLRRLQQLEISPILGFVHHGSGPRYTNLLDDTFATGLSSYALHLARRFPWVDFYTPVNEPLTTARFSALYGYWYPHTKTSLDFAKALLNQCRATVLAMRAIRSVQSNAKLVQTEDLGRTFSSPRLAYQADFETERRWLTFDLLCGKVDSDHAIGSYFLWLGVKKEELMWFQDNPCPPDVLGVNYYVTSDRYLDEHTERYPPECVGGNGRHRYVDVEAVRLREEGLVGIEQLLRDTWQRYQLPMAVTEAHLGCTREEQLRWLWEVWNGAKAARADGVDVRAVTVWSLLGAYDWNSLVTRSEGYYESGVFDIRGGERRPTALAQLSRNLAAGTDPAGPLFQQPGWWQRKERLRFQNSPIEEATGRPILISGASGTLGRAFAHLCKMRAIPYRLLHRADMDISDAEQVESTLQAWEPWAVVNAAGYVRVDEAEAQPSDCYRENVRGAEVLAEACRRSAIPLMTFSSDLVFDGLKRSPYWENDYVRPLGVYGMSKAEAERRSLQIYPQTLVIRTSAFFGPWDEHNFVAGVVRELSRANRFVAANDVVVSPTYVPDLVNACLDLLIDGASGIWHLANEGEVTWYELARTVTEKLNLDPAPLIGKPAEWFGWAALRPSYSALASEGGKFLPTLANALERYAAGCETTGMVV